MRILVISSVALLLALFKNFLKRQSILLPRYHFARCWHCVTFLWPLLFLTILSNATSRLGLVVEHWQQMFLHPSLLVVLHARPSFSTPPPQLLQARTMEGPHRLWRQWVTTKYSTHNRDLVGQTKRPSQCWLLCPSASPFKKKKICPTLHWKYT